MAAKKVVKRKRILDNYITMFETLASPKKTFEEEKKLRALEGLKYALLGCLPMTLIIFIVFLAMGIFSQTMLLTAALIIPILLIVLPVSWVMGGFFSWMVAKLLGLKSNFGNYLGIYGLFTGASALMGTVLWAIMVTPVLNLLGFLLVIPAEAYQAYLQYKMLKTLEMSQSRAIIAVLAPIMIILLMVAMIIALIAAIATFVWMNQMPLSIY